MDDSCCDLTKSSTNSEQYDGELEDVKVLKRKQRQLDLAESISKKIPGTLTAHDNDRAVRK